MASKKKPYSIPNPSALPEPVRRSGKKTVRCSVCSVEAEALAVVVELGDMRASWFQLPPGWWMLLEFPRPVCRCDKCLSLNLVYPEESMFTEKPLDSDDAHIDELDDAQDRELSGEL